MNEYETRCYILPLSPRNAPVEASPERVASVWPAETIAERLLSGGYDVAPGVRVVVLSIGDHYDPVTREPVYGALVAVQAAPPAAEEFTEQCGCVWHGVRNVPQVDPCEMHAALGGRPPSLPPGS